MEQHQYIEPLERYHRGQGSMNYCFSGVSEITYSSNPTISAILASVKRNNTDLRLFKTTGLGIDEFLVSKMHDIYRLSSPKNHAYIDIEFMESYGGGFDVYTLMLFVDVAHQNNFFNLKDFLIKRVAKTLFDVRGIDSIWGRAVVNKMSIRSKREWRNRIIDGKTKLVRLYERLGCQQQSENSVIMILLPPISYR